MDVDNVSKRPKLQRVSQACDFCHRRGLKCIPPTTTPIILDRSGEYPPCLTCGRYGQQCTRLRRPKKRGTKPRPKPSTPRDTEPHGRETDTHFHINPADSSTRDDQGAQQQSSPSSEVSFRPSDFQIPEAGLYISRHTITALIDIYLDSIYPLSVQHDTREGSN